MYLVCILEGKWDCVTEVHVNGDIGKTAFNKIKAFLRSYINVKYGHFDDCFLYVI